MTTYSDVSLMIDGAWVKGAGGRTIQYDSSDILLLIIRRTHTHITPDHKMLQGFTIPVAHFTAVTAGHFITLTNDGQRLFKGYARQTVPMRFRLRI